MADDPIDKPRPRIASVTAQNIGPEDVYVSPNPSAPALYLGPVVIYFDSLAELANVGRQVARLADQQAVKARQAAAPFVGGAA